MLLRGAVVRYLYVIEHAYYEQSGALSVYKFDNPNYENSILPEDIEELNVSG